MGAANHQTGGHRIDDESRFGEQIVHSDDQVPAWYLKPWVLAVWV
ncbi:hypothetical protein I552_7497 [Mycobacterium xenopi 3993]|nr:hypothetical protein I552_7497 [Mycobacterium xenopi 3993]